MEDQELIRAIERLTDKLDSVAGSVGRGSASGTSKNSQVPRAKAASLEQKAQKANREEIDKATKSIRAQRVQTDAEIKASKDAVSAQEDLTKEQKEAKRAQEKTTEAFKGFGKSLIGENANLSSAFAGLSNSIESTGTTFGRVAGGIAFGVGTMLGNLQEFAKNAGDMGAFADLNKFGVGSVTQMKILSGLGGSFIKVIEESQGGFKAFGSSSQEAAENLSNLSRGLKYGSFYLNSTLRDALGTDLVKSVNRASNAAAAMGMSDEERAKLMGSIAQSSSLAAKNEQDAQQRLVKQYADTLDNTRKLSSAFGVGTKEILAAMAEFRKTTAGTYASLEGNAAAQNLVPLIKSMGIESDPEKISKIALALSRGEMGQAAANVSNASAMPILEMLNQAVQQGGAGGENVDAINKNLKGMTGEMKQFSEARSQYATTASEYAAPGAALGVFAKRLETGGKDEGKEAPRISETDNIRSMNDLTAALESLRSAILGISIGITALVGSLGALAVAGGIGGLMSGKGASGALGSIKDWFANRKSAGSAAGGAIAESASNISGSGSMGKTLKELGSGAGKGIKDLVTGIGAGVGKGIELILRGLAAGIAAFANPAVLVGATILSASIAIIGAGVAAATWMTGKALDSFGNSLKVFGNINGDNLVSIGGGLAAIGAGAVVFAAGMVAATATSLITGLVSLFGAKSPIERILELVPVADKISMIGEGMFKFGSSIGLINDNLRALDLDALANFKNALVEISNIDMPSLDGLSIPQISTDSMIGATQPANGLSNILNGNSAVTPEVIGQLMSYLASIENDLAAIRGNTKQTGYEGPVRLA
jgi:hypothetical protein